MEGLYEGGRNQVNHAMRRRRVSIMGTHPTQRESLWVLIRMVIREKRRDREPALLNAHIACVCKRCRGLPSFYFIQDEGTASLKEEIRALALEAYTLFIRDPADLAEADARCTFSRMLDRYNEKAFLAALYWSTQSCLMKLIFRRAEKGDNGLLRCNRKVWKQVLEAIRRGVRRGSLEERRKGKQLRLIGLPNWSDAQWLNSNIHDKSNRVLDMRVGRGDVPTDRIERLLEQYRIPMTVVQVATPFITTLCAQRKDPPAGEGGGGAAHRETTIDTLGPDPDTPDKHCLDQELLDQVKEIIRTKISRQQLRILRMCYLNRERRTMPDAVVAQQLGMRESMVKSLRLSAMKTFAYLLRDHVRSKSLGDALILLLLFEQDRDSMSVAPLNEDN
ncbi:hypothetical protein JW905_02790 [bacterium]|nr:hypothetical protein [candidate division CSSED10-310 bacterium]